MKGLLIKDWKLLKNQKQFFLVMAFFALMLLGIGKDSTFGSIYLMIMLSMFTLSTISYDEFDNGAAFLFTLPFERRTYVREKYAFGMIAMCLSMAAISVINVIMAMVKGQPKEFALSLLVSVLAGGITNFLLLSVMIPLQLKWGSEKSRIIWMGAAAGIAAVGFGGFQLVKRLHLDLSGMGEMLEQIPPAAAVAAIVVIAGIMMLISCRIAERIVEKKEY